ncbi:hypothetical protein ACHWQZ_G008643 [Mnemiopsis leidyi]
MSSEKEGLAEEAPPSYDISVQGGAGQSAYPPPLPGGYTTPQQGYPPQQYPPQQYPPQQYPPQQYPPQQYPPAQAAYPPAPGQAAYPPAQQYPPIQGDYPPPQQYPPQHYPATQGVPTTVVTRSACNACNMRNNGPGCCMTGRARRFQITHLVVAVGLIIFIAVYLSGSFPKIPIIMFLAFTTVVNLFCFVPALVYNSRNPHTCEQLKNTSIFCR